ncbi:unnamed protein product [Urochloa decumbens]|uniref:Factor of DNA methylation 1-5/IDN2 domain-containing protein n=1 Tax=Urochloa decumbens TaxID=240449 RepID=A0ABC9AG74_9POAL
MLQDTMELGYALLEKTLRMTQMAMLSSSSKLIDGSLAEKSGVVMIVDKSKVFLEMAFKHAVIRVNMTGKLDRKPFQDACWRKYGTEDEDGSKLRAAMLLSDWQEELQKPSWHPFRIVEDANGKTRDVAASRGQR